MGLRGIKPTGRNTQNEQEGRRTRPWAGRKASGQQELPTIPLAGGITNLIPFYEFAPPPPLKRSVPVLTDKTDQSALNISIT